MTGTHRMDELAVQTVVRITDGLSKTPRLKFAWGAPVDPITVGMRGHWPIMSDSMLDVHLHIGFDGKQLLVALAAPNATAVVNGRPIQGQQWWPVTVPGTLQFGGAELKIENEGAALDMSASPNSSFDTLFDGGSLRERARQLSEPPIAGPPQPLGGHTPAPQRDVMWPGVNANPAAYAGTLQSADAHAKQQLRGVGEDLRSRQGAAASMPPAALPTMPPTPKKGFWAEASVPKKISIVLLPVALAAVLYSMDESAPESAAATPVAAASAKGAPSASARAAANGASSAVTTTRLAKTPAGPAEANTPAPSAAGVVAAPSLLASATSSSASPAPTAIVAPTATAGASNTPKEEAVGGLPVPTPRAALDAAFLGNLKDASRMYTRLANANPDNQAYRLAARLAAEDAVRRP